MEGLRQRKKEKDDIESDGEKKKASGDKQFTLPTFMGYAIIFGFLFIVKILAGVNQRLPTGLKVVDETAYPDSFIAERAENDLLKLVSLGPKVTGSYECEILAPRILRLEIADITKTANLVHAIQQDMQKPKGSFYLAFKPFGFQSIYENIQNIAVRLGPKPPSNHSVLINCHYDTVPESPGASDDGLNCAVMLEVLRKLSRSPQPLKHNLIFLFNGAEENPLQASHGFITKHQWSKEIRMVVNLDSAGAGGREILFQATPEHHWLLKTYAKVVPRPSANTGAQEIFESGLIPSDSDFRVFRDFGLIPGLDMAHSDNGYVYHTRLDSMDFVSPGVFQHTGDNLLAMLRAFANASELEDIEAVKQPHNKLVYYDIFGIYMFVYSHRTGVIFNFLAAILSLYSAAKILRQSQKSNIGLVIVTKNALLSAILGILINLVIAIVLDNAGASMAWYARPYLIFPMYVFSYVAIALLPWVMNKNAGTQAALEYFCGGQILTSVLLLFTTVLGIRTSYILMLLVIFPAIAGFLYSNSQSAFKQLIVGTAASSFGAVIVLCFAINAFTVIIPIAGRAGSAANPELPIACLTSLFCLVIGNVIVPLLLTISNPRTAVKHLVFVHGVTLFLIIFTSFGFPYSDSPIAPAFQRFYIFHTEQTLYNRNGSVVNSGSGAYILTIDRNRLKYAQQVVPELKTALPAPCNDGLLCQFPLYNSRTLNQVKSSFWLPLPPPQVFYATKLELVESSLIKPQLRRIKFSLKGPDHITLVISPRKGVKLGNWTLGLGMEPSKFEGRDYYVVYFSDGQVGDVTEFSLDLHGEKESEDSWIDISVIGHYQHQKGTYTPEFITLLKKFPPWVHITPWITTTHGYEF